METQARKGVNEAGDQLAQPALSRPGRRRGHHPAALPCRRSAPRYEARNLLHHGRERRSVSGSRASQSRYRPRLRPLRARLQATSTWPVKRRFVADRFRGPAELAGSGRPADIPLSGIPAKILTRAYYLYAHPACQQAAGRYRLVQRHHRTSPIRSAQADPRRVFRSHSSRAPTSTTRQPLYNAVGAMCPRGHGRFRIGAPGAGDDLPFCGQHKTNTTPGPGKDQHGNNTDKTVLPGTGRHTC